MSALDGYTEQERDLICELVDDLPRKLYGHDDDGWESTAIDLVKIVNYVQRRKQAKLDPRQTHAVDDRQAKPL